MANILLTGGTGVVGLNFIKGLVADGHFVVTTSRSRESASAVFRENQIDESKVEVVEVDFTDADCVNHIVNSISTQIDAVIHNARSLDYLKMDDKGEVSEENFQNEFFMGVTFPYLLNNELLSQKHPLRDIVFISSMYGVVGPNPSLYTNFKQESPINYGVTKAAQIHLTKELAIRLADCNVRSNAISYGGISGRAGEEFKKRYAKLNPLKEMLAESDIYPPLKYILDNPSLKMTGENLKVDGGWTLW